MKYLTLLITLVICLVSNNTITAQPNNDKEETEENVTIDTDDEETTIKVPGVEITITEDEDNDNAKIRIKTDGKTKEYEFGGNGNDDDDYGVKKGNDNDDNDYGFHDDNDDNNDDDKPKKLQRVKTRWFMYDLGINMLVQDPNGFNLEGESSLLEQNYGRSFNHTLHIFRQRIGFAKNHINLQYGLNIDWSNYGFEKNIQLEPNTEPLEVIQVDPAVNNFDKNKLRSIYMNVPAMLVLETNPRKKGKSFRVGAGAYGGLLLGGKTRRKESSGNVIKKKDDYNLNQFQYGLTGQVGIGPINFFANYSLTPLFADGLGSDLYPLTVGMQLVGF